MKLYAIIVTVLWMLWIIENGFKTRKIRQQDETINAQAARIRFLEDEIKAKDETIEFFKPDLTYE